MCLCFSITVAGQNPADNKAEVFDVFNAPGLDLRKPADRARTVQKIKEIEVRNLKQAQKIARQKGKPLREETPSGKVRELVGIDEEGELLYYETRNANAAISTGADKLRLSPYVLDGAGLLVGVWDGGSVLQTHQEFNEGPSSRVNIRDGAASNYHATHVGGTIAAAGVVSNAKGMAPAATIESYQWTNDISEMTAAAATSTGQFANKVYLSNHSYGYSYGWRNDNGWRWNGTGTDQNAYDADFGQYSSFAANLDSLAYNAPYYLIFWAAGNENTDGPNNGGTAIIGGSTVTYNSSIHPQNDGDYRNGFETIGDQGIAKNLITVGAANDAVTSGQRDPSKSTIASFSSTGPCDDGRIKPDLVGNGVGVYSTDDDNDADYRSLSGTSMASPNLTGSAALLVAHYRNLFSGSAMRSSTLKGLLIHTASDIGNPGPDYTYGWGLPNVKEAADLLSDHQASPAKKRLTEDQVSTAVTSKTQSFLWDGVSPIKATIAWTDPAGNSTSAHDLRTPALRNDLNLKLVAPNGTEYFPFVMPFVGTWTVASMSQNATTGINNTDNVEQVIVSSPGLTGNWQAVVSYTGALTNGAQDYGLIISGSSGLVANAVEVVYPNGGESIDPGSSQTITWGANITGNVKIDLFKGGALHSVLSANEANDSSYTWAVSSGLTPGNDYAIRISSVNNPAYSDESNAAFTISAPPIYYASMDTDPGWTFSHPSWAWGQPTGAGQDGFGNPDPSSGYNGSNVIGYRLDGDYEVGINPTRWATTPAIDCSGRENVTLSFWRWLGVEQLQYDRAYIEVSNNGTNWTTVWENSSSTIDDSAWGQFQYDISAVADGQPTVFIRWGIGETDGSWNYCGWNIDEVEVGGDLPATSPEIAVEQPVATDLVDGSASINFGSINTESSSSPFTFTIRNTGTADLTGLAIAKTGSHASDYALGSLGDTSLAPGGSTSFTITFSPGAAGSRTAALQIASNDANENPFDINLTGTGVGPGTLAVAGATGLASSGDVGGPFSPSSLQYTLSNPGSTSINWTAAKTQSWVTLSATSGTLAAGANTNVTVSINSNADSLNANSFADTVIFTNTTNGSGNTTRSVDLTVNPAAATLALGSLTQTFDGNPKPITVITTPNGLAHAVTYAGSGTAPTNAGTYAVVATITDPNYTGSNSGSLVIGQASQSINFGALGDVLDDAAPFALTGSASSGLAVSYVSSNTDVATISGNTVTVTGLGSTTITASQAGNTNYNAASNVAQTLTVVRADPLAVTGGPYNVYVNGTLSLNGGGSFPSNGQTVTAYEWDLNNDDSFGDASGATPPDISFNDLISTWGMSVGSNTIQLKITDSSAKTSTVSTTVNLISAFTWDANGATAGQTNGGGAWLGANQWWDGSSNTAWVSGAAAIFGGPSTNGGAVILGSPTTTDSLIFNAFNGTYTLGTAGQTLTINNGIDKTSDSSAVTFVGPIALGGNQTWLNNSSGLLLTGRATNLINNNGNQLTVDGTGTTTFGVINNTDAALTGSGAFVKDGTGRLNVGGVNSGFTGAVTINGGVMQVNNNAGALGDGNVTLSGGVLSFYWGTTYNRILGSGDNQVQLLGGESGFAGAGTSGPSINLGSTIVWGASSEGTATGYFNPDKFVLGDSGTGNAAATTFSSGIDFNGATRTISVPKGLHGNGNTSTITGIISSSSGSAGLVKEGEGTLVLSSGSSLTGVTTISGGSLRIGNNTAGTLTGGNYSGNISIASDATLQIWSSASQTLSGTISGAGNVDKAYGGLLTLSGPNTYTGRTSFLPQTTAGFSVNITSFNSVNGGAPTMASSSLGAPTSIQNGTIDIGSSGKRASVNLNYTGPGETTDRVINFGFNDSSSQTLTASGSGLLKFTSAMTSNSISSQSGRLILSGTGSGEITEALPALPSGGLLVNGSGTWTLGGSNSYTGPTAITGGKLFVNGDQSAATGAASVSSGATIGGTGVVGGNTTIATNGRLEFNLSSPAGSHDKLELASANSLTFSGASVLTITTSGGATTGDFTLVTAPGGLVGSAPVTVNLPADWTADAPRFDGNDLKINITSVGSSSVDHFVISSIGSSQTVGTPITGITITAQDASNATATSFTGTVTFGGTGGFAGTSATFVSGVLSGVSVTPTVSGSNLTLTVDDGSGHTGSATIVTILSLYEDWSSGTFENPLLDSSPGADPDGDGITNFHEYAFGTYPTAQSGGGITYDPNGNVINPGQPVAVDLAAGGGADFRAIFGRRKNYQAASLTYTVQFTADLTNWVDSTTTPTVLTDPSGTGEIDAVSVPFPSLISVPDGPEVPTFFRVGVQAN